MSVATKGEVYPAVMQHKLRQIRRRQCALAVVRALLLATAALLAAMLSAMIVDAQFTLFETTVRVALTASALAIALAFLAAAGARPLVAALKLRQAADRADEAVPQLEERWTTVAHFAEQDRKPQTRLERAMLQQVTREAAALGRLVEPKRIARPAVLRPALVLCTACVAALIGYLAMDWRQNCVLLARFWAPLADISATRVESLTGDAEIPRGDAVEIVASMSGLPRSTATIWLKTDGEAVDTFELQPDPERPGHWTYRAAALEKSFRYRVQAGDGRTPWHAITALDRPALAEVRFSLAAPAYVDRPKYEKPYLPDRVRALEGSRLKLEMRPAAELKEFELLVTRAAKQENVASGEGAKADASAAEAVVLARDGDGWYRFETTLVEDLALTPALFSPAGLTNEDRPRTAIQVIADRAPVARVITPNDEMAVKPDDVVDIKFEAHDDHGIARAELLVYRESLLEGQAPTVLSSQEIPLGDQRLSPHVTAIAQLDLAKFDLADGENISFAVRVADNRAVGLDPRSAAESVGSPAGRDSSEKPRSMRRNAEQGEPSTDGEAGESAGAEMSAASEREANGAAGKPGASESATSDAKVAISIGSEPENPSAADRAADRAGNASPRKTEESAAAAEAAAAADSQADERGVALPSQARAKAGETEGPQLESEPKDSQTDAAVAADQSALDSDELPDAVPQVETEAHRAETARMRLRIASRVASAEEAIDEVRDEDAMDLRAMIVQIDARLQDAETVLEDFVAKPGDGAIAETEIQDLNGVDERLAEAERAIAALRNASKDTPYAFAGLQMAEIGASHVTPARDRLFALARQPDSRSDLVEALHRVNRARELLAELLTRYDRVQRERQLAESLEEVAKIYEVYIKGVHRLLRAQGRPAANPLERKMAIVEVDQEYLDRLREVGEMRRDMMAEFARLLADDPRLLGKYMDLIKRRQSSLRDALDQLRRRQSTLAAELEGWRRVDETQRDDAWAAAAELRLQDAAALAKEAAQLEERSAAQLPLGLDPAAGAAAMVLAEARQIAVLARDAAIKSRRLVRDPSEDSVDLASGAEALAFRLGELDAAIERLVDENDNEETGEFAAKRLTEIRALAERANDWLDTTERLGRRQYGGLAEIDQQRLTAETEQLRIALLSANGDLTGQFQGDVPAAVQAAARELEAAMEAVTFNQLAASFSLSRDELADAETQQSLALAAFERAEELFDRLRRMVIEELDKRDPDDPNVAELEDPTLDRFLEQLEREPDLAALLGIPDRPRNLRVISDWMLWDEQQGGAQGVMDEAARRARRRAEEEQLARPKPKPPGKEDDRSEEEWRQVADAEQAEELLQKKIEEFERQAADPKMEPGQAAKLLAMAEKLESLRKQLAEAGGEQRKLEEVVHSDQWRAAMQSLAANQSHADEPWNRILSSLGDGLWQVRRKTPPEHYRRAIEQYQERVRKLRNLETSDAARP